LTLHPKLDDFFLDRNQEELVQEHKATGLIVENDIITDIHMHSKFSRATSSQMNLRAVADSAKIKGVSLLGTGDCLHPKWLAELRENLVETGSEIYEYQGTSFIISGEVNTVFSDSNGISHRIHQLLLVPSLSTAEGLAQKLGRYGDLSIDGRPTLNIDAANFVEEVLGVDEDIEVIPAHIWTPWFALFGSNSGFDSLEECYADKSNKIHSLETGLSSDPEMNWMISGLDKYNLLSNSDAHSHHPWRIGREVNVLSLSEVSYKSVLSAFRRGLGLKMTLEVPPEFGKYHWTGHRECNVSMPPSEALKLANKCPVCGRRMTVGVEQRVYELADRKKGYVPPNKPGFIKVLPLYEILEFIGKSSGHKPRKISELYDVLIKKYNNEYNILLNLPIKELDRIDRTLSKILDSLRRNSLKIKPGFDGVYGEIDVSAWTSMNKATS
jgi:uncharacterized protein (TIGR00375 family)